MLGEPQEVAAQRRRVQVSRAFLSKRIAEGSVCDEAVAPATFQVQNKLLILEISYQECG